MDAFALGNEPPLRAFACIGMLETRIPREGSDNATAVGQVDDQSLVHHAHRSGDGRPDVTR